MSDKPHPARRVVIKMTPREKSDPALLLNAVRESLLPNGVSLYIKTSTEEERSEDPPTIKDEFLETKSRELAAAVLDREAAKAVQVTSDAQLKTARNIAEIVALRGGSRDYFAFLAAKGFRISIDILENVFGSVAATAGKMVKALFSGGGDDKKD